MKLLTFLLFVALVGQISANAYPRYYRTQVEDSSEAEEPQSDEADENEDEPQNDDISEEVEQEKPPTFNRLFPSPQGSGGAVPTNFAFHTLMHEIDENGWKRPKENPTTSPRANLVARRAYRDDDDESEEEDEEDDAENDEAYGPDFDTMFPNPEGKQVGPSNMAEHPQFPQDDVQSGAGIVTPGAITGSGPGMPTFARSAFYQGRSQGQQGYYRQSAGRPNVRYVQKPAYVRATVTRVQSPVAYRPYGNGNRRVVQVPLVYRRTPSYNYGNRRVIQGPSIAYRPSNYYIGGNRDRQHMGGYRQSLGGYRQNGYNMGGYRQTGPVYVDNYGRRQQYYASVNRRQQNVPATYYRRPVQQFSQSPYVMRARRNQRFWNSQ